MDDKTFIDNLLAEPLLCRFALTRSNGQPFIRPMWFWWEDGRFTMTTPAGTLLTRIASRNPRISLCIDRPVPPYAGVICDGTAEVQDSFGEDHDMLRSIAARYLPAENIDGFMRGPLAQVKDRVRVVVTPESWTIWDMTATAKVPIRTAAYGAEAT